MGILGSFPCLKSASQLCLIAKFRVKTKLLKFGTKKALFGYFWARLLKNYSHN